MRKELKSTFTEAVNTSGQAISKIIRFLLTVIMALFVGGELLALALRTWVDNGCKLPDWIVPGAFWRRKVVQ